MKISTCLFAATLMIAAERGNAQTVKTWVKDIHGTTFVVLVDWDHELVSVKLRANPTHLSGAALEDALQKAVYYGAAVNCRMADSGRNTAGRQISGTLSCPWF